jgi:putative transposase
LSNLATVVAAVCSRLRAFVAHAAARVNAAWRRLTRPLPLITGVAEDVLRTKSELVAENALLRQQLIVASCKAKRPPIQPHERGLLVLLARLVPLWRDAVLLVKPDTVLKWHRAGFRLFWRRKSKTDARREPKLAPDLVALIRQMATSNVTWGSERIRGELLKLGIHVSKRTLHKYIRGSRPRPRHRGQRWRTFLRNHTVWACDFVQTYDIWFRPLLAFFIVDINSKRVVHLAATYNPSQEWTAQQLRNATPFAQGPQFIIRDRDEKYGAEFDRVAKGAGIRVIRTTVRVPLMNSVVERFGRSSRQECLEHVIILGERHLCSVLREFGVRYFNKLRPHQGIGQRIPVPASRKTCSDASKVIAVSVLGGLHHDYRAAA